MDAGNGSQTQRFGLAVNYHYDYKLPTEKTRENQRRWAHFTISFSMVSLTVEEVAADIARGHALAAVHAKRRKAENFISAQIIGLDFDTEDDASRIETLLEDPLIGQCAAIVHTTSQHQEYAPRAHALFILDQMVDDRQRYVQYVAALIQKYALVDAHCTDACRLWYGAKGCRAVVRPELRLSISLLDKMVAAMATKPDGAEPPPCAASTDDSEKLTGAAIEQAVFGTRNTTGWHLCLALRDAGLAQGEAQAYVQRYQVAVEQRGRHIYSTQEALASLKSAYRRPRRGSGDRKQLDQRVDAFERDAWRALAQRNRRVLHDRMKTVAAISYIARAAGRSTALALPIHGFVRFGIPKSTAANVLRLVTSIGLLSKDQASDGVRGALYSLQPGEKLPECPPPFAPARVQPVLYRRLLDLPHFQRGARIDPAKWDGPPAESFGPMVLHLLVVLAGEEPGSDRELLRWAGLQPAAGRRKLRLLRDLGIVRPELLPGPPEVRVHRLVEDWYERLHHIGPALTTYGRPEQRKQRTAKQRVQWHKRQLRRAGLAPATQKLARDTARRAAQTLETGCTV